MNFDLLRARRETPGCANVIHFNNAGASLLPEPTLQTVLNYIRLEAEIGAYEAALQAREQLEGVYRSAATLLGCQEEEIAIVESATRAWDLAFYSVSFQPGDRILTSASEYESNFLALMRVSQKTGARIEVIPNDSSGQISVQSLQEAIDSRVKLIALTHVPTNGGLVNPAAEVGKVARDAAIFYVLDACQSVGQFPVNVREIGCDILSTTSRKYLRGPRGAGLLYVRREIMEKLDPVFVDVQSAHWVAKDRYEIRKDARRFECLEMSYASKVGFGAAIDYALGWGIDRIEKRVLRIAETLRVALAEIPGVQVRDLGSTRCGIVSFTVEGWDPAHIRQRLAGEKINVWTSARRFTRLDMEARGLASVVRASLHYYNSEDEIERFCWAIKSL